MIMILSPLVKVGGYEVVGSKPSTQKKQERLSSTSRLV